MKGTWMLGLLVGLLVAAPALSYAEQQDLGAKYTLSLTKDYTPSLWTQEAAYRSKAKEKLVFGGKNTLFGWLELYNEPREAVREDNRSVMHGVRHGLVNMIGDTIGGASQLVTFPITNVDIPLPEGGTDAF
jgi:hypothetical protein